MLPGARDSEGRLFVTTAAPAATDPYMAGLRLTPIGELFVTGLNQAWSPAQLFANGEPGAWYDPSDLSTLFQDSAGTIPVTADGQPVGLILDKSGNDNHASQATSTARPVYRTDGTYSWLQFDGVDDLLSTAAIDFTGTDTMSVFCGTRNAQNTAFSVIVGNGNVNSVPGSFQLSSPLNGSDVWSAMNGSQLTARIFSALDVFNTNVVLQTTLDLRGIDYPPTLRLNGVNKAGEPGGQPDAGAGNYGNLPLAIGARSGDLIANYNGNIYSIIVRGALSTTQEIDETEAWVNSKTGAY